MEIFSIVNSFTRLVFLSLNSFPVSAKIYSHSLWALSFNIPPHVAVETKLQENKDRLITFRHLFYCLPYWIVFDCSPLREIDGSVDQQVNLDAG